MHYIIYNVSSLNATVPVSALVRACVWQFTVTKATPASGFWAFFKSHTQEEKGNKNRREESKDRESRNIQSVGGAPREGMMH